MGYKTWLLALLAIAAIAIIVVYMCGKDSSDVQSDGKSSEDGKDSLVVQSVGESSEYFKLSAEAYLQDAQIDIEDISVSQRDISDGISKIQSMQQKMEVPANKLLKQTFLDTLLEVEYAWQEFQTILAQPETKYGLIKAMTMPGTTHVVRPSEPLRIAVFKKDNVGYSYKKVGKDGRFLEAIKLVYRDKNREDLDKAKSYKLRFHYNDLDSPEVYMALDLSLYIRFDRNINQFKLIRKTINDKKILLSWKEDGSLMAKSIKDVK